MRSLTDLGLKGKVALIIGASSGIGMAAALRLSTEGVDVALTSITADALNVVAKENPIKGGRAIAVAGDATKLEDVEMVVSKTIEQFGRLDILVNSIRQVSQGTVLESTDEDWMRLIQTKLLGYIRFIRAASPHIQRPGGVILNLAGGAGTEPRPESAANSVVCAGLIALTALLAKDKAFKGIKVIAMNPGLTDTPGQEETIQWRARRDGRKVTELNSERGIMTDPAQVANMIAFLVSPNSNVKSGATFEFEPFRNQS